MVYDALGRFAVARLVLKHLLHRPEVLSCRNLSVVFRSLSEFRRLFDEGLFVIRLANCTHSSLRRPLQNELLRVVLFHVKVGDQITSSWFPTNEVDVNLS